MKEKNKTTFYNVNVNFVILYKIKDIKNTIMYLRNYQLIKQAIY